MSSWDQSESEIESGSKASRDDDAIRRSLDTVLAWRRSEAWVSEADSGSAVASNMVAISSHQELPAAGSHPFNYAGLSLLLSTPKSDSNTRKELTPPSVIQSVLGMIVEAHFAVWYVWHVPTGACTVPGLEELLGIPSEAVPTFIEEWLGFDHPDDLPRMVEENDAAVCGGPSLRSEYRLRRADGTYMWVSDWAVVLRGDDGRAEWMAGALSDITTERSLNETRREVSQLYDALFTGGLMPTWLIDHEGTVIDANQAALSFLESAREAVIGEPVKLVLSSEFAAEIQAALTRQGDLPLRGPREMKVDVAGVAKWLLASIMPFETQDGYRVFVHGADLTAHKRVSEALVNSEESLRQKTQALEERNIALRVLMDQKREAGDELIRAVTTNIAELVVPTLDRLEEVTRGRPESSLVEVVRLTLADIAQPLVSRIGSGSEAGRLSRREYEVFQLVRAGKTTDEIAEGLCLSPSTVAFHRSNIRRKLGLLQTGRRLASEVTVDELQRHLL